LEIQQRSILGDVDGLTQLDVFGRGEVACERGFETSATVRAGEKLTKVK
jgi:hypothetical protein